MKLVQQAILIIKENVVMLLLHAIYFMYTAQLEVHTKDKKKKTQNQASIGPDFKKSQHPSSPCSVLLCWHFLEIQLFFFFPGI